MKHFIINFSISYIVFVDDVFGAEKNYLSYKKSNMAIFFLVKLMAFTLKGI